MDRAVRRLGGFKVFHILAALMLPGAAQATPSLVIDVATGDILHQEEATQPWFPASVTKLMTAYVALKAIKTGRITFDTPFTVSSRAARMAPSKMGFKPGTEVTVDNALKMLMVKSANDLAVTIAEGVSGSVEAFAGEMNQAAADLGMRESRFVNPNGLPDARQIMSARDLGILGRALLLEFPEQTGLFGIGALRLGSRIIPNHNGLIGRYPGVDGMKTGFTCSAGFNVVASATHGSRRLIAVVLGAPSTRDRTAKAAALLDKGFNANTSFGRLADLPQGVGEPPNMRAIACGGGRNTTYTADTEDFSIPLAAVQATYAQMPEREFMFDAAGLASQQQQQAVRFAPTVALLARPAFVPVPVFVGRTAGALGPVRPGQRGKRMPAVATAFAAPGLESDGPIIRADPLALPLKGKAMRARAKRPVAAAPSRVKVAQAAPPKSAVKKAIAVKPKSASPAKAAAKSKPHAAKLKAKPE